MITHKDPLRSHGIRHFHETQGLPDEEDNGGRVGLVYGDGESPYEYTVRVAENEFQGRLTGWVEYEGGRFPLYETPKKPDGKPRASFTGDESYPCVAKSGREITVGFDVFSEVGSALSGRLDMGLDADKTSDIPFLDLYERLLFDCLRKAYSKAGVPLIRKALWPDAAPYAVCLTHDVDEVRKTYQHISGPIKYALIGQFGKSIKLIANSISDLTHGRNPYWTFEELIRLEEELGVKSSLYFLEEKGKVNPLHPKSVFLTARRYEFKNPKITAIIKRLDAGGWDIGLHGSYYSYNNKELLKAEKEKLEAVLGHQVTGTRQHHLNLKIPETWRSHEDAGLQYDCTLGYKDRAGFRWGTCLPFNPYDQIQNMPINLLEIPTTLMDTPLFYAKNNPQQTCDRTLETVKQTGGVLTLLWHHTVFNDQEFPGWPQRYQKIIQQTRKDKAWVTNGREVAGWWARRRSAELSVEFTGGKPIISCQVAGGLKLETFSRDVEQNMEPLGERNG